MKKCSSPRVQVAFLYRKKGVEISLRKFDRRGILITQPPKKKKSSINAVVAQLALKSSAKKSIDLLEEVLCTIGILMDATIQNDFFYL